MSDFPGKKTKNSKIGSFIAPGINLVDWFFWCPSISNVEDPNSWDNPVTNPKGIEFPECKFVPMGIRRRLSPLGKILFWISHQTLQNRGNPGCHIYSSEYGEIQKSIQLLSEYFLEGHNSPLGFSVSVHNTAVGLYSIYSSNVNPNVAIGAGKFSYDYSLVEGVSWLNANPNKTALVTYIQCPAPEYWEGGDKTPWLGLSILLSNEEKSNITLSIESGSDSFSQKESHLIPFLKWLHTETKLGSESLYYQLGSLKFSWNKNDC